MPIYCVNIAGTHDVFRLAGRRNIIWKLKILPKVKILLWRVGQNVLRLLRMCMRLNDRIVQCLMQCAVYNEAVEDNLHALYLCPCNTRCWQQASL
jgi:hypothetical protein